MSASADAVGAASSRTLHATPGRIRLHIEGWTGHGGRSLERRIRELPSVKSVRLNAVTGNVLVQFVPGEATQAAVVDAIRTWDADGAEHEEHLDRPPALMSRDGHFGRVRIAVRGLDRDPVVARSVVERLRHLRGVVHVSTSPLTGRVLVEFDHHEIGLDEIAAHVADVELPDLPGRDRPAHPLDPGPLVRSTVRTVGAGLGLGLLAARQLAGVEVPVGVQAGAVRVSAGMGIIQGFPIVRSGLRRLLGPTAADLLIYAPTIVGMTLAGSPLGLVLTAAEALRLLTEVVPRRRAWQSYEERLGDLASAEPGAIIRLEAMERAPLTAGVIEGTGTAVGQNGLPQPVFPGATVPAGARLYGGPFVLELNEPGGFTPQPRPAPPDPTLYSRYIKVLGPLSLGYAALTALATRSLSRGFAALLLVSPRTALIGLEAADAGASARVLRSGVTVVGTRPDRTVRLPHSLLVDGARVLTDGFEITTVLPLADGLDTSDILELTRSIAAAAGSPWGGAMAATSGAEATEISFDGATAGAVVGGARYALGPITEGDAIRADLRLRFRGEHVLVLRRERDGRPLALIGLRPRLAAGVTELVETCRRHGVKIAIASSDSSMSLSLMERRTGIEVLLREDALQAIRERQAAGELVSFLSDTAGAREDFDTCDLAIGLTTGRRNRFPARADLLAPDLAAVAAIIESGARRETTVRDSVLLSALSNLAGAVWGVRSGPSIQRAAYAVYVTALGALTDGWIRLRGGRRSASALARLVDPHPEKWGRRDVTGILQSLNTSESGLSAHQALERRRTERAPARANGLLRAVLQQLASPLNGILAGGAVLSFLLGSPADVAIITASIAVNAAVGAWQERRAGQAVAALQRIGPATARVRRGGEIVAVRVSDIVPGDILVLGPGDRVAADARLIKSHNLEVDEAALTGESVPVRKVAAGGTDASRVVLAGTDVTVGHGHAVVVAVGRKTRLGATAAALELDETGQSPLGLRLNAMFRQILPLVMAGGAIVFGSGVLRGAPTLASLAIAATIAIAAVPEGLPLLASVGEAAVARRLGMQGALVQRLSAVEALGRVDVACTDKTGTVTEGRLALQVVAGIDGEGRIGDPLPVELRDILLTAGLATPHPDAGEAAAHPTDLAVMRGAETAGIGNEIRAERARELPFDPARPFHASMVGETLYLKGAFEALLPRCNRVRHGGTDRSLDSAERTALESRVEALSARGLRVLMVAQASGDGDPEDRDDLIALGFIGISDPLRPGVSVAVQRCHAAGVRLVMLTGDHPTTARAIAHEAGLLAHGGEIVTGADISELQNGELDRLLQGAVVVARVTPLDKLRIVESLQRMGHVVAMTGDGVNDAPALRLADVGVAMGRTGTEVARQAADVVLAEDDFTTLVEALVEGRSFWRNIRRALALLLGGNLGELGLMVGASIGGLAAPLVTRQILAVNLITDALPALAVALQPPETRNLAGLIREGEGSLHAPLRNDVLRRGVATAMPSLAAFTLALRSRGLPEARSVAFAGIVATQLAQTLDLGRAEGTLTRPVLGAVASSTAVLLASLTVPPLRTFLALATPSPFGWVLIGAASLAAVLISKLLPMSTRVSLPSTAGWPWNALSRGLELFEPRALSRA